MNRTHAFILAVSLAVLIPSMASAAEAQTNFIEFSEERTVGGSGVVTNGNVTTFTGDGKIMIKLDNPAGQSMAIRGNVSSGSLRIMDSVYDLMSLPVNANGWFQVHGPQPDTIRWVSCAATSGYVDVGIYEWSVPFVYVSSFANAVGPNLIGQNIGDYFAVTEASSTGSWSTQAAAGGNGCYAQHVSNLVIHDSDVPARTIYSFDNDFEILYTLPFSDSLYIVAEPDGGEITIVGEEVSQLNGTYEIFIESPSNSSYLGNNMWFNITVTESPGSCEYTIDASPNVTAMQNDTPTHFYSRASSVPSGSTSVNFHCEAGAPGGNVFTFSESKTVGGTGTVTTGPDNETVFSGSGRIIIELDEIQEENVVISGDVPSGKIRLMDSVYDVMSLPISNSRFQVFGPDPTPDSQCCGWCGWIALPGSGYSRLFYRTTYIWTDVPNVLVSSLANAQGGSFTGTTSGNYFAITEASIGASQYNNCYNTGIPTLYIYDTDVPASSLLEFDDDFEFPYTVPQGRTLYIVAEPEGDTITLTAEEYDPLSEINIEDKQQMFTIINGTCNNDLSCGPSETQESCSSDCITTATIPASVAPGETVSIGVEFWDGRYSSGQNVKIDLTILPEGTSWTPLNGCFFGGKEMGPAAGGEVIQWPAGTASEDGHFKIETICTVPSSIPAGAHTLFAVPTIF